jgi:hypothetical protein
MRGNSDSGLAAHGADLPLQSAHAGFTGIVAHHLVQGLIGKGNLFGVETMALALTRHQIGPGNTYFLMFGVAIEHENFHAIPQGVRNQFQLIRRGDKNDVAKVEIYIEIVIAKSVILCRVQDLQ